MWKNIAVKIADVRLSDCADAQVVPGRLSKRRAARLDKDWSDCQLDDFDLDDDGARSDRYDDEDQQLRDPNGDEQATAAAICTSHSLTRQKRRQKLRRRRNASSSSSETSKKSLDVAAYPTDVWYAIALFLKPQDLGRFAAVCRTWTNVIRRPAFWKQLYYRYYDPFIPLPERLKPHGISRVYGLRTCVIKSLFYTYPLFVKRVTTSPNGATGVELSSAMVGKLCRGVCLSVWYERASGGSTPTTSSASTAASSPSFIYFFKFAPIRRSGRKAFLPIISGKKRDKLAYMDDFEANLEADCFVVKITTTTFHPIPTQICGWRLSEVAVSLASDLRTHRLRLGFQSVACSVNQSVGSSSSVQFESIRAIAVLDWWHPQYPLTVI